MLAEEKGEEGRGEESIAILCFQATDEEGQKSPHIRELLK